MLYSTHLEFFMKKQKMNFEDTIKLVSKLGFDAIDHTSSNLLDPDCLKHAVLEFDFIEKNGLFVTQTHAPYNRYNEYGNEFAIALERAYEITKIFGAKYMVVHGDEYEFDKYKYSPERALQHNYEIYAPYIEKAEKDGVCLAFETVFEDRTPEMGRFCSKAEDLKELIEKFKSPAAVCCWDFGHANIAFGDEQADKIRLLGKHIKCTHIHDNRLKDDLHLPLFTGDSNLAEIRKAFHDINYDGVFSLELGGYPKMNLVPSVVECFTKYALDSLKIFADL